MNFGSRSAAMRTALYPPTVACELSVSMLWARVMRGMASMLMALTPAFASFCASSGLASVPSVPMRTEPSRSISTSSSDGLPTRRTTSAWEYRLAASGTSVAPASRYASSVFEEASPAPAWTRTSMPSPTSWPAIWGVSATRVSPSAVSRGTAIFIRAVLFGGMQANRRSSSDGAWRFGIRSVAEHRRGAEGLHLRRGAGH